MTEITNVYLHLSGNVLLEIVLQTANYASWCNAIATFLHFVLRYVHNQKKPDTYQL